MESRGLTSAKPTNQNTSFQPTNIVRDNQTQPENLPSEASRLSPKDTLNEKILQGPQIENKLEISPEKGSKNEAMSLENVPPNEQAKTNENDEPMAIEESTKLAAAKSREILYGDDAPEETKKQIEALYVTAQLFASKEDYKQAIHIYNRITRLNEKSIAAWIAMGHCFAMLEENYEALKSYQQALNITSDSQKDDQLWYGIGLLYQKIEDWKNAETSFRNALKLNPSPSLKGEILYHLGVIMKVRGDHQEGIKMLTNSILLGSFSVERMIDILCNLGTALEELNEMNEAMQTYKYALILDENNYRALQCIAWLHFQIDKVNEALDYLNKAGLLNDDDANTSYMKARCYLKLSQHNKGYEFLHKCINKDSANSTYWCSLGILFAELTQFKSAHECLSNALKFNQKSPENYFNMGCLFELCSQWNDAINMYDKALELQPNLQLAQTRKQGIYSQMENKNISLEVQFKHHKFTLSFTKDIDKEKPIFFFSQANQFVASLISQVSNIKSHLQPTNESNTELKDNKNMSLMDTSTINTSISQLQSVYREPAQQSGPASTSIPSLQPTIPQIFGGVSSNIEASQANAKPGPTSIMTLKSPQTNVNNSFMPKQLTPTNRTLGNSPFLQTPDAEMEALLSRIGKQGMYGPWAAANARDKSQAIGQPVNDFIDSSKPKESAFAPANSKALGTAGAEKKSNSGFAMVSSKNDGQDDQHSKSFKLNSKTTGSHPGALKLDPQLLGKRDEDQKVKAQDSTKSQNTGFKLTPKAGRGEEGLIPQKKIKLDKNDNNGIESVPVDSNKGTKKTQSLVLRPSPLNN